MQLRGELRRLEEVPSETDGRGTGGSEGEVFAEERIKTSRIGAVFQADTPVWTWNLNWVLRVSRCYRYMNNRSFFQLDRW